MGNKTTKPMIHSNIYIDCCNNGAHNTIQDICDGNDDDYRKCCCFKFMKKTTKQEPVMTSTIPSRKTLDEEDLKVDIS
jgi:hypothetical protein